MFKHKENERIAKVGTYHQRTQLKRSQTKVHLHERASRMLRSTLSELQVIKLFVEQRRRVNKFYTSNCDFNSDVHHEEKSQKMNSFISHKLTEFAVVKFFTLNPVRKNFSGSS